MIQICVLLLAGLVINSHCCQAVCNSPQLTELEIRLAQNKGDRTFHVSAYASFSFNTKVDWYAVRAQDVLPDSMFVVGFATSHHKEQMMRMAVGPSAGRALQHEASLGPTGIPPSPMAPTPGFSGPGAADGTSPSSVAPSMLAADMPQSGSPYPSMSPSHSPPNHGRAPSPTLCKDCVWWCNSSHAASPSDDCMHPAYTRLA